MASNNTLNARLINKHDIEANWLKATNFTPLQGELIVYDVDENYNYERIKMGDGVTNVNKLPFISSQVDWNQNDENAPDYVKNRTHWVEPGKEGSVVMEQTELNGGAAGHGFNIKTPFSLTAGEEYIVTIDGTEYQYTAVLARDNLPCIGNGNIFENYIGNPEGTFTDIGDPDAPFFINTANPSIAALTGVYGGIHFPEETLGCVVSIRTKNEDDIVHKLDPKFMHETVVMAERPEIGGEVVILPETNLEAIPDEPGMFLLPITSIPEAGKVYTVNYNGAPYDCTLVDLGELDPGVSAYVMGNITAIFPPESGIPDEVVAVSNPDAPFFVGISVSGGQLLDPAIIALDGSTAVTLSISCGSSPIPKQLVMDTDGNVKWEDRTHYEEIIPNVDIWADDAPEFMFGEDGMAIFSSSIAPTHSLIDGQEYTVVINGVEYVRNCTYMSDGIEGYYCLGNIDLMMETGNNGDPFVIILLPPELFDPNDPLGAIIYDLSGALDGTGVSATAVTASVSGPAIVTHKIDEKYLPDSALKTTPQSDWNAANGVDGHVLNRTHWFDPEGTVLWDRDLSLTAGSTSAGSGSYNHAQIAIAPNSTYLVKWGDTEYTCVAKVGTNMTSYVNFIYYIGNGSAYHGGEDTGEPFCIATYADGSQIMYKSYSNTPAISHVTVTVGPGGAYHQIDDRFVNFPETVNSDWDANEVEEGHILNRTHWVEHDVPVILQNPEFELYEIGEIKCYMLLTKPNRLPTEGEVWRIKVDGIVYECEAHKQGHNEIAFGCMGNREDDNSEPQYQTWAVSDAPFLFVFNVNAGEDATSYGVFWPYSTIGLPTLIEGGDIVHKISRDYTRSIKLFDGLGKCSIRGGAAEQESALYQMGDAAFAIGKSTKASGNNSFAGGGYSEAIGARSQAFGYRSKTLNADSQAIGYYATAIGYRSHAEGEYTTAYGENSHAEGSSYTNIAYQLTGDAGAKQYTVYNYSGEEIPDMSPYVGAAVFDGQGLSTGAVITGASGSTIYLSQTLSESAALSKGHFVIRFGVACGDDSHAEGTGTIAFGAASHSEGFQTRANGDSSHAEGNQTCANGNYSHAEGSVTSANGVGSHAEGIETIASSRCQHVQGIFNIEDSNKVYAHIVGNGYFDSDTSSEVRSNAHAVDWSGNAYYAGDVYVQGDGKTSGFSGKKKLSTEEYVESYAASLIPTPEDAVALMIEMGFVDPVADENGAMYTDDNGKIFTY